MALAKSPIVRLGVPTRFLERCLLGCVGLFLQAGILVAQADIEFFERRIRPLLVEHCYECHSAESQELQGGLRLDLQAGWQRGGESGQPAIVPFDPEASPVIRSVRHDSDVSAMPPGRPKLSTQAIADLTAWIQRGAADPRIDQFQPHDPSLAWETAYRRRLQHWSLQPVVTTSPPSVHNENWVRTDVDRFILAKLEAASLQPAAEANRFTLLRRLSFALTGLPPDPQLASRFDLHTDPEAYDQLLDTLLASPHFGERWARHWMDVVHYSDTHGYEWDVPAKNAWRYRDYLVRAFNADLPYNRFVLEQIAGDLLEPRVDPDLGINESMIGPMMLRLGERRHGDNAAAEGVTQEAVANMIDTLGKAFLGTTLACAQCHDHKLEAIEQRDYYALSGMLMSTRFSARPVDSLDANRELLGRMKALKQTMRGEIGRIWLKATAPESSGGALEILRSIQADANPANTFPASLAGFWKRSLQSPVEADEFLAQRDQRMSANREHLTLVADFTGTPIHGSPDLEGWRWEGWGMHHGLVRDGEPVIADEGESVLQHLLPAGRFSHVFSPRLAGSLQSPQLDPLQSISLSIGMLAGKFASASFVVDRALNPERMQFPSRPQFTWETVTAGNFDSLEGTVDQAPRQVYFELATKSLNNYFPPRVGYGGVKEEEIEDERSWFGVTRIFQHPAGHPPQDELQRFVPLFGELAGESDWARRLVALLRASVERWVEDRCTTEDVLLLNEALQLNLLPNQSNGPGMADSEVPRLLEEYRQLEKQIQPDRTVGSAADWNEGQDSRIGIRGSYTELGDAVPRGQVRWLSELLSPGQLVPDVNSSRRLDWARQQVDPRNPLTARVYVNRVWHYLFGAGLVRTPDDFGHLGETPTHPELLDYLADRFIQEGWSTKKLIRLLVRSAVWRQSSVAGPEAIQRDPENRLWHHLPMRRLEAETIRDSMLTVSQRLDLTIGGQPTEPHRMAEDAQKRLFRGPLDGDGRRSLYIETTLMEPARFMALFNQPIPKQTVGRRDVTNVPDQALALLNDPFVIDQAKQWSQRLMLDGSTELHQRVAHMVFSALGRPATAEDLSRLLKLADRSHRHHGDSEELLADPLVWQDVAHAIFNLKEFIYVP